MKRKSLRKKEVNKRKKTGHSVLGKRKFVDDDGKPRLRPKGPGDWSLPGYNYLGPGNPTNDGYLPTDEDDRLSMVHDDKYGDIERTGQNPYVKYGEDDEEVYQNFGHGYGGYLGKAWFGIKKHVWGGKVNEQKVNARRIADRMEQRTVNRERMRAEQEKKYGEQVERRKEAIRNNPLDVRSLPILPGGSDMTQPRHIIPNDEDHDMGAGSGTSEMRVGATAGGSMVKKGDGETAVDPIPTRIYNPFRKTEQVFMKYYKRGTLSPASGALGSTSCTAETFRLNSIYDIQTLSAFVQDPTPAADAADGTVNTPTMREYWSNFYRYWTVTKCHYKIHFWSNTVHGSGEFVGYVYFHGQQHPPVRNYLADTRVEHFVRKSHPNMYFKKFHSIPPGSAGGSEINPWDKQHNLIKTVEGTFVPGSINNLVSEDDYQETWHKMTEVPSHRELLTIMTQRTERSSDITYNMQYNLELIYEVQLKDLKAQYEFLTADSAIPAIAAFAAQAN